MIYSITSSVDTTIYQKVKDGPFSASLNAGSDEILEIQKEMSSSLGEGPFASRFLIKFDLPDSIKSGSDSLNTFTNPDGTKFSPPTTFLKLYSAQQDKLLGTSDYIEVRAISQSWSPGIGRRGNTPITTEGCSWNYRDEHGGNLWKNSDDVVQYGASTHSVGAGGAAELPFHLYSVGQSLRTDIKFDVSYWIAKMTASSLNAPSPDVSINNHGFLVKRDDVAEVDNSKLGTFTFFSSDTHTIYQPRLEFCWDDSSWSTGSLSELNTTDASKIFLYLRNNRGNYTMGEKIKFRVVGREKYPVKTYGTTSANLSIKYLPSGSAFYSVKDLKTGETVIPYDTTFTKMSCDSIGNYFEVFTTNLSPERYYQLEIKLFESGSTTNTIGYYPIKDVFKVVR